MFVETSGDIFPSYLGIGPYTIDHVKVQYYWQDHDTFEIFNLHTVDAELTSKIVDEQHVVGYVAESSPFSVVPCADLTELVIIYYRDADGGLNNWVQGAWYPGVTLHRTDDFNITHYAPAFPEDGTTLCNSPVQIGCAISIHCERWDWELYRNDEPTPLLQFSTDIQGPPYNLPTVDLSQWGDGDTLKWHVRGYNRHAGEGPWSNWVTHPIVQRPKVSVGTFSYSWLGNILRLTAQRNVIGSPNITWQGLRYKIGTEWILASQPVGENPLTHDFNISNIPSTSFIAEVLINYTIVCNGTSTNYQASKQISIDPPGGGIVKPGPIQVAS